MPESTCLHIQERESGPIRVVEIPWISVRIGRAAHCEVRLPEHDLAEEVCRLYRRGGAWQLVPATTGGPILLAGQPVDGSCPLPFDVPFRVGPYCLTLRHDRAAEPDWGMYSGPALGQLDRAPHALEAGHSGMDRWEPPDRPGPHDGRQPATGPAIEPGARPLTTAQGLGPHQEFSRTASVREGWETRWRVAGAQLKARSVRSPGIPESKKHPYQAGFDAVPLKEPRAARVPPVVPPVVPPSIDPAPRPTTAPPATWAEPETSRSTPPPGPPHPGPLPNGERAELRKDSAFFCSPRPIGERVAEGRVRGLSAGQSPQSLSESAVLGEKSRHFDPGRDEVLAATTGPTAAIETGGSVPNPAVIHQAATPDDALQDATSAIQPTPEISIPRDEPTDAANTIEPTPEVSIPRDEPTDAASTIEPAPEISIPRDEPTDTASTIVNRVEWPSAKDILATHRVSSRPRATVTAGRQTTGRRTGSQAFPTLAREPGHWNMPVWLAGPPAALLVVVAGLAGCVMSWLWACDSYSASIMTDRLLTTDRSAQRRPLPESVAPPYGTWTRSTAQHLAHWAIFLSRFEGERDYRPEEIPALLGRSLEISPINPTARLAVAQLEPPESGTTVSIRSLGLSRDALSLAWTARRLLAAGKKDAALKLYGQSLSVAMTGATSRGAPGRFSDDPRVPRYLLPGEERVRDIVRDLAERNEWTFREWSAVIPDSAMARLAAARLLREQGRSEAEALLELILDERQTAAARGTAGPLTLAARAEAFALRSRWREAGEQYRQAIELSDDDTIKRSWWFNLADIAFRLDDENQRHAALRAALAVAASDDITRRATAIQRATRRQPNPRSAGVKAN